MTSVLVIVFFMKLLPQARRSDLVVQTVGNELLVYDLKTHRAYSLNETSKIVFDYCDSEHSFDDLKREYEFTDDLIHLTLGELQKNNLLEDYRSGHFAELSRREVIKKVGLASAIALPMISSLAAPTPAAALPVCIQNGNMSSATSTMDDSDATKCKRDATAACCSRNSSGSTTTCDGCDIRTRICTSCVCSVNCV